MSPDKPLFSIITVSYNAEKTIERTIQSVQDQTCKQLEYIIIDGASKDRTLSIIDRYKHAIDKLISEPDKGLYDAMNKGIDQARGVYLCFLNAGDVFHQNNTLEEVAKKVNGQPTFPDVVYGDTAIVDNKGQFVRMRRLSPPTDLNWKSFKQGMLVCHQAFLPKLALCPKYKLKYRFSADFDWCIEILKKTESTYYTKQVQIDYLEDGLTTQNRRASLIERFRIMQKHYGLFSTCWQHLWFVIRALLKK